MRIIYTNRLKIANQIFDNSPELNREKIFSILDSLLNAIYKEKNIKLPLNDELLLLDRTLDIYFRLYTTEGEMKCLSGKIT